MLLQKDYFCRMEIKGRIDILKHHNLRITDCRLDVLDFFISAGFAIATKDLEDAFTNYDRVTLYRTLNSFVKKGVIHAIPDDSGFARYGVCHDTCSPEDHKHDHMHFKCTSCGTIECIADHHVPEVVIPGYLIANIELIINGTCKDCNSK
ncbi:MAG: Fur family ferric uptake transcriptional regulator [Cyclobacteriaceae bacterium]|jgi:Fur family ferric uptake transcriptional regulator